VGCCGDELEIGIEELVVVVGEGGKTNGVVELVKKVLENEGVFTAVAWLVVVEVVGIAVVEGRGLTVVDLLVVVVVIGMLDVGVLEGDLEDEVAGINVLDDGAELDVIIELDDEGLVVELNLDDVVEEGAVYVEMVVVIVLPGSEVDVVPLPTPSVNDPTGVSEMSDKDVEVVADGLIYVCGVTIVETNGVVLLLEVWLFGSSVT
jgi:hypothetical protein